ncbi:MAG TPA: NADH-dependent [FeFe] hydrogenase, group A6 [Bacteroidales bacterium]|nr:NADH-dependent [FeFe] hydrogenase, group A6 [Bacteroidales bacterium]
MSFLIEINNKQVEARKGETILDVLKRNGIKVPTLCHLKDMFPTGSCRMCVVENLKTNRLVTSCSTPVEEGMKILTHSARVVESRKTIVELLLSNHPDDCLYCVRNKNCELQNLSEELHVRERRIRGVKNNNHIDRSSVSIVRDPDKCILCGRCVRVCEEVMGVSCIDFINRGSKTVIGTTFNQGLNTSSCVNCGQCIMVCPTGALSEKSHFPELLSMLSNPEKTVVVQYAPAISVSLAEELKLEPGKDINGIMNAALRKIGFKYVFDTTFTADLTIMEEASELVERVKTGGVLPMITSCCPGWIKFAEEFYPEMIPNLSSCKSPQQMMGAVIKTYWSGKTGVKPENIYSVSVMPCTAKKFEAQREEMTNKGITDVDAVLTTRELGQLIRMFGIDMNNLAPETTDSPLGYRSSAGKLFAASGGVMEAAIRTAYHFITGDELIKFKIEALRGFKGCKEAEVDIDGLKVKVAVVNGLANARILLDSIKRGEKTFHFIEIMACPGGCLNGGGQHIGASEEDVKQRMKTIYDIDDKETIKVSHKNPEIIQIYEEFLEKPLGHKSHELLHTHYYKRDVIH